MNTLTWPSPAYTVLKLLVERYRAESAEAESTADGHFMQGLRTGRADGLREAIAYMTGAFDLTLPSPVATGTEGWIASIERLLEQAKEEG